jgi:hypothetical protein
LGKAIPGPTPDAGTTEFIIDIAFKKHPLMAGKERLILPRYLPNLGKTSLLMFCDVYKGKIDPYRGVEAQPGGELVRYFRGLLVIKDRPLTERLRYAIEFFDSPDGEIVFDVRRQFLDAGYKGYRAVAKTLPREKLIAKLRGEHGWIDARRLYALLLAECGEPKDAEVLREQIRQQPLMSPEEFMAAQVLLQPAEGWDHLRSLLADGNQDFLVRYQALKALRFLCDERPDVIPRADRTAALLPMLIQPDMSDFAIEELRKRGCLGMSDRILPLFGRGKYNMPVIRRAILRYALCSPSPRAAAFVREQRRLDPGWVSDVEELLRLELEDTPLSKR